jgi:hypothetical protein
MTATTATKQPTTAAQRSISDRSRTIIASLLILGLVGACIGTIILYRSLIPVQVDRSTINIARSDYEQALAKWQARNVVEYTTTVTKTSHEITIRVNRQTGDIFLLKWLKNGEPYEAASPDPNTPVKAGLHYELSVDGMFETVAQWLDVIDNASGPALTVEATGIDYYGDFNVQFHPELGYPVYVASFSREIHRSREVVWRSQPEPTLRVRELTINK